jgi:RNA-directed DNA polymerase
MSMRPRAKAEDGRRQRTPYQWVIEGDIKGCFDNIDHHQLMERVRARVADGKVTRLIAQFLKAGVLSDGFLLPTDKGTPQGGVSTPFTQKVISTVSSAWRWISALRRALLRD